jgi:hypothetical protein
MVAVQGGGLRLSNLPKTLPGNVALLRSYYGDLFLALAVWGGALALARRRLLFLAAVPYCVLALLFFSCWARPDTRYLVGIYLFVPMLVLEGTLGSLDLVRRLARGGRRSAAGPVAMAIGLVLLVGMTFFRPSEIRGALPLLGVLVPGIAAIALAAAAGWPARRIVALAAPALALTLVGVAVWRTGQSLHQRASFQRPQMLQARATLARAVERGAVVITSEDVGRPAENIDYYSGVAHALYLTDLARWRMPVPRAAELLAAGGLKPYLFVPSSHPGGEALVNELGERFTVELAADVPPRQAMDYFVAAAFHRGVRMLLFRLTPRPAAG